MFQTPFSDRIRNDVGIPTLAVGNIFEPDHVNSIIAAGRADLCCLARPHLVRPLLDAPRRRSARTLRLAAPWPKQYMAGKEQLERQLERGASAW